MAQRYIWYGGRKYYYYDTYTNYTDAYAIARMYKRKNRKCKWFISKEERGIVRHYVYHLYMTRVMRLTWL